MLSLLSSIMAQTIGISDVQLVASYSWIGRDEAIILVPGKPKPAGNPWRDADHKFLGVPGTWNQQTVSDEPKLKPDRGTRYIDNNARRCPKSPAEPLVRAVLRQQPHFDFSKFDMITDRHTITSLLNLFRHGEESKFQCAVEVAGNTIIFDRNAPQNQEPIKGYVGCRMDFEEKYFTFPADCQDTASHHRIITYKLGELRIMLRHAADGMIGAQLLDNAPVLSKTADIHHGNLIVRSGGQLVPEDLTLELSVRMQKPNRDFYKEKIPHLWISQTPHFIVAAPEIHKWAQNVSKIRSRVPRDNITIHDAPEVQKDLAAWEANNQPLISRLHTEVSALLQELRTIAKTTGQTRHRLVYDPSTGKIVAVPDDKFQERLAALPKDLVERLGGDV